MRTRLIASGIAISLLFVIIGNGVAVADTQIGVTLNIAQGAHTENAGTTKFPIFPLPIFSFRHRSKRIEVFAEGLPTIGPITYGNTTAGQPQSSQVSYLSGVARYYTASGRFYFGLGASEVLQRTDYAPRQFGNGSFRLTSGQTDASRLAGGRYEVGALLVMSRAQRIHLSLAALPSIHATLYKRMFYSQSDGDGDGTAADHDPDSHSDEYQISERASMVDTSVTIERDLSSRLSLVYGARYLNITAAFPSGNLADHNHFIGPFIGVTRRI